MENNEMFHGMEHKDTEHKDQLKELQEVILEFRSDIESAWGKSTAYPDFKDRKDTGRYKAKGQGAVTARLLKDILNEKFPGLKPKNVVGSITIDATEKTTNGKHAWVEIPLDNDTLVIDVTPDQNEALGIESSPVIFALKSDLEGRGVRFNAEYEDTDQIMQASTSKSLERYKILKRRYQKVCDNREYYKELNNGNVFIIASVGAGKTELLSGLQETTRLGAIDVGKLFRTAAYLVLNDEEDNPIKPDIQKNQRWRPRGERQNSRCSSQKNKTIRERFSGRDNNASKRRRRLRNTV